jgi:hypothetical protein
MPPARAPGTRLRAQRAHARERAARRARRFAGLAVLSVVLVVSLALTAFGRSRPAELRALATSSVLAGTGRPSPEVVARVGALQLQLPIAHPTAIGYHGAGDGALALSPAGRQGNEGLLDRIAHKLVGGSGGHPVWYQLDGGSGPATSSLDVGAAPGTDVYAPVDGTVVGIAPYIVDGRRFGSRIDIQPQSAPALVVSLTHLRADPSIVVGSAVVAGGSKLGAVVDLSSVEHEALARYTQDAGNHVSLEVRPAATLTLSG